METGEKFLMLGFARSNLPKIVSCVDKKDWGSYVVHEFVRKHTLQIIIEKKKVSVPIIVQARKILTKRLKPTLDGSVLATQF